jgi:diacylglycerol kinase (ATP)
LVETQVSEAEIRLEGMENERSMKLLFIVNGQAGKGKGKKHWSQIESYLDGLGISYDVHFTAGPKEATEVARRAAGRPYTHVIAVGGDGTVNEVVNGLYGQPAVFGVIPTGTGNDFARMLQIPRDPLLAVQTLFTGRSQKIDLMQFNNRLIVGTIGIGLDGAVAEEINRSHWKKRFGTSGYVISMLKQLRTFRPFTLILDVDETKVQLDRCWMVAIGNSSFYGGGMKICPNAKYDDGLLDVCIVNDFSRPEILAIFPSVFFGKHVRHPKVLYFHGKKIRVRTEPCVYVHGDGEILGQTPGEILIHPQALNVIS